MFKQTACRKASGFFYQFNMNLKRFIRNNRHFIPLYRSRVFILIVFYFMALDIKYDDWLSLLPISVFCILYTICFLVDAYRVLKKNPILIWGFKRVYYILMMIVITWLNIISSGQIVTDTGFSYSNFSIAIPSVFIVTSLIIIIPLYNLLILGMAIFYEMRFFLMLDRLKTLKVCIKFSHVFIMFILAVFSSHTILNKAYPFVSDNIVYPFRYVFVYSSYYDIPNQCTNKSNLIEQFGKHIQIAFIGHEIISIAIPDDDKSYIFLEGKCHRKE